MLTAVSDSFWDYNYLVCDEGMNALARAKINWGGESGAVTVDGRMLEIRRDGMTGPWLASANGEILAKIVKPSAFSRAFEFTVGPAQYRLAPRTWSNSFDFLIGDENAGSLERAGFFTHKMIVNLPDDLPLMVKALAVWIVLLMWRRVAHSSG
jgi:hypothetical protein